MVRHGCSGCADYKNTNFKTIVLVPSEILRCKVLAWPAVFWQILAAQTIAESNNLTSFLTTLIFKIQYYTTLYCITSKGPVGFVKKKYFQNPHCLQIQPVPMPALGTQCTLFRGVCEPSHDEPSSPIDAQMEVSGSPPRHWVPRDHAYARYIYDPSS